MPFTGLPSRSPLGISPVSCIPPSLLRSAQHTEIFEMLVVMLSNEKEGLDLWGQLAFAAPCGEFAAPVVEGAWECFLRRAVRKTRGHRQAHSALSKSTCPNIIATRYRAWLE